MKYITIVILIQYWIIYQRKSFSEAIIGHNIRKAHSNEFTFIVSISHENPTRNAELDHICTAALVTKKHVLTAFHCYTCVLERCRVIAGSTDLSKGKRYKVKSWFSYDEWAKMHNITLEYVKNDVAIVTLKKSVESRGIIPARITELRDTQLFGLDALIAGWGVANDGKISTIMQATKLKVLTRRQCKDRIDRAANENTEPVPTSLICTIAEPYALLGRGESGGPLLDVNNNIIGISVATCPITHVEVNPLEVNVHISIPYYKQFILSNIA